MDSQEKVFHHCFDSWKVYPRLDYFHCRFKEVFPRFQRIAGVLPECFGWKEVIEDLERRSETFKNGFQVTVHGEKDLDPDEFLMVKGFKELKPAQHHLTTVHVYRIDGKALSVEQIRERVSSVFCNHKEPRDDQAHVILSLDKNQTDHFKKQKEELNNLALDTQELSKNISYSLERRFVQQFQIIFEYTRQFERINCSHDLENESSALESVRMKRQIQDILGCKYIFMEVFHTSLSSKVIDKSPADRTHAPEFYKRGSAMEVETKALSKEEIEMVKKNVEENLPILLNTVARKVRCAAVELFADKYSLHSSVCNSFMTHVDFEDALAKCFVKNTKYHLQKLAVDILTSDWFPERSRRDFVLHRLEDDMHSVFKELEKMFTSFKRLLNVMKKLSFEIEGYLKQSIVEEVQAILTTMPSPEIGDSLRKDLLSIEEVYGVGTFYGKLEIHISTKEKETNESDAKDAVNRRIRQDTKLDTEKEKQKDASNEDKSETEEPEKDGVSLVTIPYSTAIEKSDGTFKTIEETSKKAEPKRDGGGSSITPESTSIEKFENDSHFIAATKSRICDVLKKHRYRFPFSIKFVVRKPVMMCIIKPGDTIYSDNPDGTTTTTYMGTCGAFCFMSGKLVGLTCGHVVGNSEKAEVHVSSNNTLISETQEVRSLATTSFRCIDIAALKLVHNVENECKNRIEAGHRHFSQMQVWRSSLSNLQKMPVFKFGAGTGFTTGTIASTNYSCRPDAYLIMIAHGQDLPVDVNFKFPSLSKNPASVSHHTENFTTDPISAPAQKSEITDKRRNADMDKSPPIPGKRTVDNRNICADKNCTKAQNRDTGETCVTKNMTGTESRVKENGRWCIIDNTEDENQETVKTFSQNKNIEAGDTIANNNSLSVTASHSLCGQEGLNLDTTKTLTASNIVGTEDQENETTTGASQATLLQHNETKTNMQINSKSGSESVCALIYNRERDQEPNIPLANINRKKDKSGSESVCALIYSRDRDQEPSIRLANINRNEANNMTKKKITLGSDWQEQSEANKSRSKAERKEIPVGQINDCSGQTNYQTNGDIVFVRSKRSLSEEDMRTDNHKFCKEGDSGAVVCVCLGCEEHYALSMLLGGGLKVSEGDRDDGTENDDYSCSFKLYTGLSALRRMF